MDRNDIREDNFWSVQTYLGADIARIIGTDYIPNYKLAHIAKYGALTKNGSLKSSLRSPYQSVSKHNMFGVFTEQAMYTSPYPIYINHNQVIEKVTYLGTTIVGLDDRTLPTSPSIAVFKESTFNNSTFVTTQIVPPNVTNNPKDYFQSSIIFQKCHFENCNIQIQPYQCHVYFDMCTFEACTFIYGPDVIFTSSTIRHSQIKQMVTHLGSKRFNPYSKNPNQYYNPPQSLYSIQNSVVKLYLGPSDLSYSSAYVYNPHGTIMLPESMCMYDSVVQIINESGSSHTNITLSNETIKCRIYSDVPFSNRRNHNYADPAPF